MSDHLLQRSCPKYQSPPPQFIVQLLTHFYVFELIRSLKTYSGFLSYTGNFKKLSKGIPE